jgi:selenide, water dikinase
MEVQEVKLTQFSHGAGCGCKISPKLLDQILHNSKTTNKTIFPGLLVGNDTKDDAAVLELDAEKSLISTTDFFMPIVDDAYDFGRIASANAISDVYAMGGKPILAIAILGWPIDKIAPEIAGQVLEGSRAICKEAGIPLAGGHSIDCPEPVFGLAVNGIISTKKVKMNSTAKQGDVLYLTKPIGVGILTTAQKKGILKLEHKDIARDYMVRLNSFGQYLADLDYVHAVTDVTGFGLLGHLSEMCEGSELSAEVNFAQVPLIPEIHEYLKMNSIPGGTKRNWDSYGHKIQDLDQNIRNILADPQTSGGLLIAVDPSRTSQFEELASSKSLNLKPIGSLKAKKTHLIEVV